MASNVELLTHSHNVIRAKKRQKLGQVKTVVFDDDARREFLTGFHKRKLAKKEESKKKAQAREKEERLEARQEHRRMLAEQAAQNAARVEEAYGGGFAQRLEPADGEWTGIASSPSSGAGLDHPEHEYEYSDEEQLATVTVVEDFDPSALLHGEPSSSSEDEQRPKEERRPPLPRARAKVATRGHSSADVGGERRANEGKKNKNKNGAAKKVRYETKAARRATRATQRARRTEKAERAGGKAARKKTGGRRPRG